MTDQPVPPMPSLQSGEPGSPNVELDSSSSALARRSPPNLSLGVARGLARKCPACGVGSLFCGYLTVRPICLACANENGQYPSDDFAPYVTIFLVLHLFGPPLFFADRIWELSTWTEGAIALPLFLIITLLVLPFAKGGVIGFAWSQGVTRGNQP